MNKLITKHAEKAPRETHVSPGHNTRNRRVIVMIIIITMSIIIMMIIML